MGATRSPAGLVHDHLERHRGWAIGSGIAAGSIALVSFGADSYVEVFAGSVILWRLAAERHGRDVSDAAERRAVRLIAVTFLVLAGGVAFESVRTLLDGDRPDESAVGIALALVSLVVMPLLARAKRQVGEHLDSRGRHRRCHRDHPLRLALSHPPGRVAANAAFGWWWADPLAALGVVYVAAREGVEHWNADELDDCC